MDLKVSFSACKYVIYRPEHKAKDEPCGIEFWSSLNAKQRYTNYILAQRVGVNE